MKPVQGKDGLLALCGVLLAKKVNLSDRSSRCSTTAANDQESTGPFVIDIPYRIIYSGFEIDKMFAILLRVDLAAVCLRNLGFGHHISRTFLLLLLVENESQLLGLEINVRHQVVF